ncbi:hypothetical protein TNCV_4281111 [Trichonephila clavipes]|nr:hypothetical protein TNCV_4281111 [Trichonephila clavipes]
MLYKERSYILSSTSFYNEIKLTLTSKDSSVSSCTISRRLPTDFGLLSYKSVWKAQHTSSVKRNDFRQRASDLDSTTVEVCGSPVVKVSDHGRHAMSSSPVPLKTRRVGQRCTLNLTRAETSSLWCGMTSCTNQEMADIHFLANEDALEAQRLYEERFPLRRLPNRKTFERLHRRLRETSSYVKWDARHQE